MASHTHLRRLLPLSAAAMTLAATLGGCVAQDEYNRTSNVALAAESRVGQLTQENQNLKQTISRQTAEIDRLRGERARVDEQSELLAGDVQELQSRLEEIQAEFSNLNFSAIDPATDRALKSLAASQPELFSYDAKRGVVRLSSDLTFPAGSDQVQRSAAAGLRQLASALLDAADSYDLRVVGHTDSQRIGNPATKAKHPTNRHLSVHRAISVSEALQAAGWPANRVEVAGWGAQRPAVANNAKGGTPENRRVEIYVVPTTETAPPPVAETGGAAEPTGGSGAATPQPSYPMK